jgi:hypothetical protein
MELLSQAVFMERSLQLALKAALRDRTALELEALCAHRSLLTPPPFPLLLLVSDLYSCLKSLPIFSSLFL